MIKEHDLIRRIGGMDCDTLDALAELTILLTRYPGIGNPNSRNYHSYPDELKESYNGLREAIPREYSNSFLIRFSLGEFGSLKPKAL